MNFSKFGKIAIGSVLAAFLAISASADFQKTETYQDGLFSDVPENAWYTSEVKNAYELGFMNGTSGTLFSPDGNVTVAQGITMAVRLNALNSGKEVPTNGTENWYDSYVAYAIDNGIIADGDFDSYTRPIKRHEMAELIYDCMPRDTFTAQNVVYSIPDVSNAADYTNKLLVLYNAGIVMGSDGYGNFMPDTNIKRCECAAIINRVALPENRLKKELIKKSSDDAYILCDNASYTTNWDNKNHINSGWVYDNRGAAPSMTIFRSYGTLVDVSDEYGTAMIREFNEIYNGTIVTETSYEVNKNGFFIEFRDNEDNTTYQIKLIDNSWQILGADGKYTVIMKDSITNDASKNKFYFRILINLDNKTSTTYINDINCGTFPLLSDNVLNYRYATDEASRATVNPGSVYMVVNYNMNETFDIFGAKQVYGWTVSDGVTSESELKLPENSSAQKTFEKATGKVTVQSYILLPDGGEMSFSANSANTPVVTFESKNGKFLANGKEVYTFTKNMWYRLRIDADFNKKTADILLNGRSVGTVSISGSGIDSVSVKTGAATNARFDYMKVYEVIDHDDYVPEPTTKANYDDYIVGMDACSLWINGSHRGWACISPFDEPKPVLGYYDEGIPETADWEIKYMVEHGVDFQALCWYSDVTSGPLKKPTYSDQLHEGYMYAKYSDYMDYALIWEALSGKRFNAETFRNYVIPYWFENYFLDDRYLVIDNYIILYMFGSDVLYSKDMFGSVAQAKQELDYLDEVAKSYGFNGVIIINGSGDSTMLAQMGIEGLYAYGWGTVGNTASANIGGISNNAKIPGLCTVPIISTGFDSIPWHDVRYGNISLEDFAYANKWVRDSFFPKHATDSTWSKNMVMLGTWNEYGEGHFLMPAGLNGFGYMDIVRDIYSDLPETHEDILPTAAQSERINHRYPQYSRVLRSQGWYTYEQKKNNSSYGSVYKYEFTEDNTRVAQVDPFLVSYGKNGVSACSSETNKDPNVFVKDMEPFDVTNITKMAVTLKVPSNMQVEIYFTTENEPNWSQDKCFSFITDEASLKTYNVSISNKKFTGKITQIRIDPVNKFSTDFTLKSFEFLENVSLSEHKLYINDLAVESEIPGEKLENGTLLFPFDPVTGEGYILNVLHTWRKDSGTLKIEGNHHVVEYLVGSSKYYVDGKQKDLGYELYLVDGLPMLSFKSLSQGLGYEYEEKDGNAYVKTAQYSYYESLNNRPEGAWEFNAFDTEGWVSNEMDMNVVDGILTLTSKNETNYDPKMTLSGSVELIAEKYTSMEIKVRYKYTTRSGKPHALTMFYITDKDTKWNHAKTIACGLKSLDSNGEWETFQVDLTEKPAWKNTITNLRFDPFDGNGMMEIDYIRFIADPDYVYIDPATIPFSISNGDAEDTSNVAFYSGNATISIIEDPRDSSNHVYNVVGKSDKKSWTYFRQAGNFKVGKKYSISFDICLVEDASGAPVTTANFCCNMRYPEDGALNGMDHLSSSINLKVGEWQHVELEHIVKDIKSTVGHEFTIYANPTSETGGLSYLVDNVVVVESDA